MFLLPFVGVAAHAQTQEEDVAKRLQSRNVDVAKVLYQNKSFVSGSVFGGPREANVKSFYFAEHYNPKAFLTRPFYAVKNSWSGDFKFNTSQANLDSRSLIPNAAKAVETKTSATKTAGESGKTSATQSYNTREYRGREAQNLKTLVKKQPDEGTLEPMTMDQVRELLNKNK